MIALERLPAELRASRRAVCWRRELRHGRWTKVPYQPRCPARRAAVDAPATWGTFLEALAVYRRADVAGVGVVLGAGLAGVDLDHVRDARTGIVADAVLDIVRELDSYTELSPSREGLHVLLRGELPAGGRRAALALEAFPEAGVELYCARRFFTVTGQHVAGTPATIAPRHEELAALYRRLFRPASAPPSRPSPRPPSPVCATDEAVLRRAFAGRSGGKFARLWHGDASAYASRSEADLALCNLLAFWTGGDAARVDALFRRSGLYRAKWDDRRGGHSYGARTIACALGGRR